MSLLCPATKKPCEDPVRCEANARFLLPGQKRFMSGAGDSYACEKQRTERV